MRELIKKTYWYCECECGNKTWVDRNHLLNGDTKSCGCLKTKYTEDLTGKTFGRWVVLNQDISKNNSKAYWICQCSCESKTIKSLNVETLIKGKSQSCGCLAREIQSKIKKKYNTYDLTGKFGIGYTFKGEEFYFDLEDYNRIKDYCWCFDKRNYVIASTKNSKNKIWMHQLIVGYKNPDHKNRIRYDNRKENLRPSNQSENVSNGSLRRNNKSGIIGVFWYNSRSKWVAKIEKNYKPIQLGYFTDFEEAVRVRLKAEKEYFGEFAPQQHLFEQYGIE